MDRLKSLPPRQKKNQIHIMSMTALMTAVMCILAPLSLPIGPIPISLTTLIIFLSLYLIGWKMGTVSCILYILIGLAGLPVFSGFSGGLGKLLGPTGGYIIGFVPMAVTAGLIINRVSSRVLHFIALLIGSAICYILGTVWFCLVMDSDAAAALTTCVIPFIPTDLVKASIAITIGPLLKSRLQRAGLLN